MTQKLLQEDYKINMIVDESLHIHFKNSRYYSKSSTGYNNMKILQKALPRVKLNHNILHINIYTTYRAVVCVQS